MCIQNQCFSMIFPKDTKTLGLSFETPHIFAFIPISSIFSTINSATSFSIGTFGLEFSSVKGLAFWLSLPSVKKKTHPLCFFEI